MRIYHERLRVPVSWWLLGVATIFLVATELVAGFSVPIMAAIYLALILGFAGLLLAWGRVSVVVSDMELRAGRARLPLGEVGRVAALDQAQTRALRGPRGDPAAFLLTRPYLREAVYVEVARPVPGAAPYWLLGTRRATELAAAIERARPAAHPDGAVVG